MARARNFGVVVLVGASLLERPSPKLLPRGTSFVNETTGEQYVVTRSGSANVWTQVSGGGSGGGLSTKYWVSPAGVTPAGGYTTIPAAVAAAVADLHDENNPATITLMPGVFIGDVHLPNGISIEVPSALYPKNGTIIGNVFVDATAGSIGLANLVVVGSVIFQGAASQPITCAIENCFISSTDHSIIMNANDVELTVSDTSVEAPATKTAVRADSGGTGCKGSFDNCILKTGGGAGGYAAQIVMGGWSFKNCLLQVGAGSFSVIQGYSLGKPSAVSAFFENCRIYNTSGTVTTIIADDAAGVYEFIGGGGSITGFAAGVILNDGGGAPIVHTRGGPNLGRYQFANLPTNVSMLDDQPPRVWVTDGCAPDEATGAGTGVAAQYIGGAANRWCQQESFCSGTGSINGAGVLVADARIEAAFHATATLGQLDASLLYVQYVTPGVGNLNIVGNAPSTGPTAVYWRVSGPNMRVIA